MQENLLILFHLEIKVIRLLYFQCVFFTTSWNYDFLEKSVLLTNKQTKNIDDLWALTWFCFHSKWINLKKDEVRRNKCNQLTCNLLWFCPFMLLLGFSEYVMCFSNAWSRYWLFFLELAGTHSLLLDHGRTRQRKCFSEKARGSVGTLFLSLHSFF